MIQKNNVLASPAPNAKLARRAAIFVVYAIPVILVVYALASLVTSPDSFLPNLFIALAGSMTVLALHAIFQTVRTMFGADSSSAGLRASLPERAALSDEKNALLRAIKDIAFERDVGKLSDEEFARLDRSYRLRAKEVLRKLDEDIVPYLERAERLLGSEVDAPAPKQKQKKAKKKGKRRVCSSCATSNASDAEWCKSCGASVVPVACPKCSAPNEPDAKFCNKCAAPMKSESAPEVKS